MNGSTLTKAFLNLPGGGTAIYNSSGLAYYRHSDQLGSSRLTSTQARGLYSSQAYAPFGEQYATYPTAGSLDPSYTGQNSDAVPSLYDFTFREHSMSQGRWISPDPLGIGAVNPSDPQTWNRYAYVGNSPLNFVDPSGLQQKGPSGGGCNSEEYDCGSSGGGPSSPGDGSDVYINGLFAGQFYGTVIPITVWNGERLGSMGVVIFGGWMAGEGGEAGGASANNRPQFIPTLRLVPKSDYCAGGDRHILYWVQTLNSNNTPGAMPSTTWYVTEQQTVKALAPPNGTSTDITGNKFDDWISGAGQTPADSIQTFTVAQSLSANATSYSIMVRVGNQDYGSLGIHTSNPPIVQGVQCPASLAQQ